MSDELAAWLRVQLDDDEQDAQDALKRTTTTRRRIGGEWVEDTVQPPEWRRSVWGPARVLREIDAKRQMLAELLPEPREPETNSELHARFAHPAYEYRTTTGPRKQWDDVDLPPCDELGEPEPGWERNTDVGREGWDRLDYTEESYWRRRLPAGQERRPQVPRWLRLLALPYAGRPGYREEWRP